MSELDYQELYRLVELYLTAPEGAEEIKDHYDNLCAWYMSHKNRFGPKIGLRMKHKAKQLNKNGVPKDPNDWTFQDWKVLSMGIKSIKTRIASFHKPKPAQKSFNPTTH